MCYEIEETTHSLSEYFVDMAFSVDLLGVTLYSHRMSKRLQPATSPKYADAERADNYFLS
jgi:hypothetical protein